MDLALGPAGQAGGHRRGAGPVPGGLSPAPLVRRDGGRLRVRRGPDAAHPAAVADHAGARDGPLRAVCRSSAPGTATATRAPWKSYDSAARTLLSFLNCQKYPPSLLVRADGPGAGPGPPGRVPRPARGPPGRSRLPGRWVPSRVAATLGRVPLFYYLLQWPVVHLLATSSPCSRDSRSGGRSGASTTPPATATACRSFTRCGP